MLLLNVYIISSPMHNARTLFNVLESDYKLKIRHIMSA